MKMKGEKSMARKTKQADKFYWDEWYAENKDNLNKRRRSKYVSGQNTNSHRKWREKNRKKYNAYHREYYKRKKLDKKEEE